MLLARTLIHWSLLNERIREIEVSDGCDDGRITLLTACLRDGDEAAWAALHREYAPRLLRYLMVVTCGREDAAREALQQTWLRCVRHIRSFSSEAALWSWLTVLARSSVVDEQRKTNRFLGFLERWRSFSASPSPMVAAPEAEFDVNLLHLVQNELNALPPDERRLMNEKYLEHLSTRDLAEMMGTTEKAIESRLARLRHKIKSTVLVRLQQEPTDEN